MSNKKFSWEAGSWRATAAYHLDGVIVQDPVGCDVRASWVHASLLQQAGRVQLLAVAETLPELGVQNTHNCTPRNETHKKAHNTHYGGGGPYGNQNSSSLSCLRLRLHVVFLNPQSTS
jgi:hypothetical protein